MEVSSSPSPCVRVKSVTREEIDRYWRMRRTVEEDHLLAAEKAAARIRAKALKEEDYRRFEDSLEEVLISSSATRKKNREDEEFEADDDGSTELWVGIKNWWTRSRFAYLNQPAIKSMGGMLQHHHVQLLGPASAACLLL